MRHWAANVHCCCMMLLTLLLTPLGASESLIPTVVIDPGHGGEQKGAIGVCGVEEKFITLEVAKRVAEIIEQSTLARVLLTRDRDVDVALSERPALANRSGAALFVSIHANASPRRTSHGIETFILSRRAQDARTAAVARRENAAPHRTGSGRALLDGVLASLRLGAAHAGSRAFAERLQDLLSEEVDARNRGVLGAPFVVLQSAEAPAILVELGFLTNERECAALATATYRQDLAQGVAVAILAQLSANSRLARATDVSAGSGRLDQTLE